VKRKQRFKAYTKNELTEISAIIESFKLTLRDQQIVFFLISKMRPDDKNFSKYSFSIKNFCKVCGIDYKSKRRNKEIEDAIQILADKSIWYNEKNDGLLRLIRIIETATIDSSTELITIGLDADITSFLAMIGKNLSSFELHHLSMNDNNTLKLYNLLNGYVHIGKYEMNISELIRLFCAGNYKSFASFEEQCIIPTLTQIGKFSNLIITYENDNDKIVFSLKRQNAQKEIEKITETTQLSFVQ